MLVRDDFQRRGVGTQLLQNLLNFGRDEGIRRVVAYMLPENRGMIEISEKLRAGRPGVALVALLALVAFVLYRDVLIALPWRVAIVSSQLTRSGS